MTIGIDLMHIDRDATAARLPNALVRHERHTPSSSVFTFSDPNEYGAAIRAERADMTVTSGGPFSAKLVQIDLHRLWMQRFTDSGQRLFRVTTSTERAVVSFSMREEQAFSWEGQEAHWGTLYRIGTCSEVIQRSAGPSDVAGMSLPVDDFKRAVSAINHHDVKMRTENQSIQPAPVAIARLRSIYSAASALAENAPSVLANPEAARSLKQELVLAMVECATDEADEDGLAVRHHHAIMRRFRDLIEANVGNPLYLHEICAALGVSGRTLQRCCHEQIGISPLRYLWLRRMHMVRRALTEPGAMAGSVTETATRYGFWELGRFSVAYRGLFGERPIATLHPSSKTALK
jgi:AraC-like DNA-binding protein